MRKLLLRFTPVLFVFILQLFSLNLKAQSVLFNEAWTSNNFTANSWSFSPSQGNWQTGGSYIPTGGTNPAAFFNWSPTQTNYSFALTSQIFDGTAITNLTIDYLLYLNNYSTSTLEQFAVEYKTVGSGSWSILENFVNSSGSFNVARVNQSLAGMDGQQFQIRFRAFGQNSYNLNGWGLDNIVIKGTATTIPGNPSLFIPADSSVNVVINQPLIWSTPFGADGYRLTLGTNAPNYNNILNNSDIGNVSQYLNGNWNPSTTYGWKVVPYNSFGNATGSVFRTFTTVASGCEAISYCPITYTAIYNEGISNVTFAGINNTTGNETQQYGNYTSLGTYDIARGTTYPISVSHGNYNYIRVYYDWNQDGDFDDSGELYDLGYAGNSFQSNGPVLVPTTASLGLTRMRVVINTNSTPISCNSGAVYYGQAEDYCVNVTAQPGCLPPAGLAATINSSSSITLNWTNPNLSPPTSYQIEFAPVGTAQGAGTIYSSATTSVNITGLPVATSFRYFVRTNCGGTFSDWVGPYYVTPNNSCSGAVSLGTAASSCTTINQTGTQLNQDPYYGCAGNYDALYYSFVATASNTEIVVTRNNTAVYYIELLDGTCGSLNYSCCQYFGSGTTSSIYPAGLTIGQTYYIRLTYYSGTSLNPFDISICYRLDQRTCTMPAVADYTEQNETCSTTGLNEDCSNAEEVTFSGNYVIQGTMFGICLDEDNTDTYYLHIPQSGVYSVNMFAGFPIQCNLYEVTTSDPCGSTSYLAGNSTASACVSTNLTTNTTLNAGDYLLYVYYQGANGQYPCSASGINNYQVSFTISGCAPPSIASINPALNNATVSLTPVTGATSYSWEVVPAGNAQGVGVVASGTSASTNFNITGLSGGTAYTLYLMTDCGGTMSAYSAGVDFLTLCGLIDPAVLPFEQNFDALPSTTTLGPAYLINDTLQCWSLGNGNALTGTNNVQYSSTNELAITLSNDTYGTCKVTELINTLNLSSLTGMTNILVSFDLAVVNNYYLDPEDKIFVRGSSNDPWLTLTDWGNLFNTVWSQGIFYTMADIDLDSVLSANGQSFSSTTQFNFSINSCYYAYGQYGYEGITLDNFKVYTCPEPVNPVISNVTVNSAGLSWTAPNGYNNFEVYYGAAPLAIPNSGTTPTQVVSGDTTLALSSLSSATDYQIYVRTDCGSAVSNWTGPINFSTPCPALTPATLPLTENFDALPSETLSSNNLVICYNSNSFSFETDNAFGRGFTGTNSYQTGIGTATFTMAADASGNYADNSLYWGVNLSSFTSSTSLLFEMEYMDLGDETHVEDKIYFRGSASDPWIPAFDWNQGPTFSLLNITLDVDSILTNNGQSVGAGFQVRVRQYDNLGPGSDGLAINSMRILQDNCGTSPNNLGAMVTGPSSADLSWTSTGSETLWDIVIGPYPLTVPGLGTTPTYNDVTSQPYSVTGLTANGTYEFYVRAQCGAGVTSIWEGPFQFTLNDECLGAAPITQTASVSYSSFNERAATMGGVHCAAAYGTTYGKDVWFSFVPTTSKVRINILSSSSYQMGFELLDGNCATNTNICCTYNATNSSSIETVTSDLVIGQTYYLKLGIASSITNPIINISVSNPPAATCSTTVAVPNISEAEACGSFLNNTCATAENISISSNPFYIWGNAQNQCSRHDTDAYAFSVSTAGVFQFDLTAPFNSRLQVYNTTPGCASLVQVGNILGTACVLTSANLSLGVGNYVVMVINNANSNSQLNTCGLNAQYELKIISNCSLSSTFITSSPGGSLCAGTPLTLTANPAGASYSWNTGAVSQSIVVNSNGIYSVNITDGNGCTGSSAINVSYLSLPTVTKSSNSPVCVGGNIQLNASGGISYSWTGPNSFASSLQNPVINNASAAAAGTYYVSVNGVNGCTRLDSLSVTITPIPFEIGEAPQNLGIIGATQIICANNSATISLTNSQPFVSYQLLDSASSTLITSALGSGGTINLNTGILNTNRVFKINAVSGSCSNMLDTFIHINMSGGVIGIGINASGPLSFCQGGSVDLTAQPNGAASYLWSNGSTNQQITATLSGTYTVTVSDNGGCTATASATVTVNSPPVANTNPSGVVGLCNGSNAIVTALPSGSGHTYLWSDGSTGATNTYSAPGSYYVIVTNAQSCVDTAYFNVNLLTSPTVSATNGGPYCAGQDISLTATGTNIVSTLWSGPNGFSSSVLNPQILSSTPANGGVYTVVVTGTGGCTASSSTTITFNGSAPVISFSGNTDFTSHVVYPLADNPYSTFRFEATYMDADGNLPQAGYPKVLMDYEPNGAFNNTNDRVFIMAPLDPTDNDVTDGKIYYYEGTALPTTANWQTTIRGIDVSGCETNFGPAAEPDVLDDADIFIFANDISFSNPTPDTSETIVVSAIIHNESDFPAQNFVVHMVNQYDPGIVYPDIPVALLPAHSTTTVQWTIVTPNVPSWNPMQVFIDYTNQIIEPNELDNQAIRPFINGPYNLPGGITVMASPSPATSYAVSGNMVSIVGNAVYYGTPVVLANPGVAGATVTMTLVETGAVYNGYTNSNGYYGISFYTPVTPGLYHVNISITDFTLTGDTTTQFVLIVPPCSPDLSTNLSLSPGTVLSNGTVNADVTVSNNGCTDIVLPTLLTFTLSNGSPTPSPIIVPPLAVGENYSTTLPVITAGVSGTLTMTATADASNLIVESNESNNTSTKYVSIIVPGIDLYLLSSNINQFYYYLCQNQNFNWTIRNGGVLPAGPFDVIIRLYRSGVLETTWTHNVAGLGGLSNIGLSNNYTFTQPGSYSFEIEIDAPVSTQGVVAELNEGNNFGIRTTNVIICQPDLSVLGCGQLTVAGTDPPFPGNITINAKIHNGGTDIAVAPIDVELDVAGTIYTHTINADIPVGGIETISITVPNPAPGNNSITVMADSGNDIAEASEGNNTYSASLCVDVRPSAFCYGGGWWTNTQVVNVPVSMNVGLSNYGIFTASQIKTKFEVSGPGIAGWLDLGYASNFNFGVHCSCPSSATLPTPFAFNLPGTYLVKFTADYDNQYIECDESNNEFIVTVNVTNLPDYRVYSQYIAPSLLNPDIGEAITIDVSYKNFGVTNIGTQMELFTQVDNTPLDSVQVIGLASGDQLTYNMPTPWSSNQVGVHVIRTVIDHDNEVPESVEYSNNEATRAIIVGQSPNLYFSTFTADILSPSLGDLINIQMGIPNNGDEDCDAQVQLFYVNDLADTVLFTAINVSVAANDTAYYSVPWSVLDASTTIVAMIVNAVPAEFDNTDNTSAFDLGTIQLSVFTVPENCAGSNTGMAIVTATGGVPPYSYSWSNGVQNDTLTGGFGVYTVQVSDAIGNISNAGAIISLIPDLNPPLIFNIPSNITYTASAGECPVVINWPAPSATDDCDVTVFSSNYNPGDAFQNGIHTVTYTAGDAYGNVTTASFTVNIIGTPLTFAGVDQTVCSSATLAAFPATFGTGTWSSANGLVNFSDPNDPAATASNLTGGANVIYWTITNGGCSASVDSLVITDTCSCPLISIVPLANASCTPGNNGSITLTVSGGALPYSYLWSNGSTGSSLANVMAADYDVVVTDNNGCTGAYNNITVPAVPGITSLTLTPADASCGMNNGSIDLSVSGGTLPFVFLWNNGATTDEITGLAAGNYQVLVTDGNGCQANGNTTVNASGGLSLSLVKTDGSCSQDNGTIDLTINGGTAPYTINWSNGATTEDLDSLTNGTYTVNVTDALGCMATATENIIVVLGVANELLPVNPSCGSSNGIINVDVYGGQAPFTFIWNNGATTEDISGLPFGFYDVLITDANGCTSAGSTTLSDSDGPQLSVTPTDDYCSMGTGYINMSLVGGTPPYNFAWNNGETTPDIYGLFAGNYSVIVTDSLGCAGVAATSVINQTLSLTYTKTDANCGANDGSIDLTVTGGYGSYSYFWSNGEISEDVSSLAPGIYQVIVYDYSGCVDSIAVVIGTLGGPVVTGVTNDPACGANDGSIDVSVSGGTAPYTYSWLSGELTEDISLLTAGNYEITVTDSLGCSSTEVFTLNATSASILSITQVDETCTAANGSIDLTVTGGTAPFSFAWSNGAITEDISGLSANTYNVMVTDSNGCVANTSATITNSPSATLSISQTDETCSSANGTIDLTVTGGTAPFTYAWDNGAITEDISGLAANTYNVVVTDFNGCVTNSTATLSNSPAASLSTTQVDETCSSANGSIDLTVTGGTAPFTFAWSNGATSEDISSLSANTYNVLVTDSLGCATATSVTLNNFAGFTLSLSQTNETCSSANGSIDLTVTGGVSPFTYAWDNGAITEDISGLAANTYNVVVTDFNGCVANTAATITNLPAATLSTTQVDETCSSANGSIDLTVTGGVGPFTYVWDNGAITEDISGLAANTYNVVVTDFNGCVSSTSATITNSPTATLSTTQVNETCSAANGSIDLTVTGGVGPFTYAWDNGAITEDISGLAANTYNVVVTDFNGCVANTSVTITNSPTATLSTTQVNETCSAANGSIDLTVTGGVGPFTYAWDNGAITEDISGLAANTYNVVVTDFNGCVSNTSVTLSNSPTATLSTTQVNETCSAANGSIDLTVTGGVGPFTYAWDNGAITEDISGLAANTYNVVVIDFNGCVANTAATITNTAVATLSSTQINETCSAANGSIDLAVAGGTGPLTYAWDNGAITEDISGLAANTYNVVVTDSIGCVASTSVVITNTPGVVLSTVVTDGICSVPTGSVDLTISGGTSPFTIAWGNGAVTEDISSLAAGTYIVLVTDSAGCTASTSATVNDLAGPQSVSLTSYDATCGLNNGSVQVNSVTGGSPVFEYSVDAVNFTFSDSIFNLAPGAYQLYVRDTNTCILTQSFQINAIPVGVANAGADTALCSGNSVTLNGSGGVTYSWDNGAGATQSVVVSPLVSTTYTLTITDANGCNSTDQVLVTVNANPAPPVIISSGNTVFCSGDSVQLSSPYVGGNLWSTGSSSDSIIVSTGGQITLTYTDANGCFASDSSTITVNPLPAVLITAPVVFCQGAAASALTSGTPAGGVYAGQGINAGTFDPVATGPGLFNYSYTYTDANGCSASDNGQVLVNASPLLTVLSDSLFYCKENAAAVIDAVSPAGGNYSGTGVTANQFDPVVAGEGIFNLTYTYTDGNACTNSVDIVAQVGALSVEISDNITGIINEPIMVYSAVDYYRSAGNFTYQWEPASLFNDPTVQIPLITTPTDTTITVTISDGYCTASNNSRVLVVEPEIVVVVATSNPGNGVYDLLVDNGKNVKTFELFVFDEAGALVWNNSGSLNPGRSIIPLNISMFADGGYILQFRIGSVVKIAKLIKSEGSK